MERFGVTIFRLANTRVRSCVVWVRSEQHWKKSIYLACVLTKFPRFDPELLQLSFYEIEIIYPRCSCEFVLCFDDRKPILVLVFVVAIL